MSGTVEQVINIAGTNERQITAAVQLLTGADGVIEKAEHPESRDYPSTFSVWDSQRNPIIGVSRLHRPKVGSNGAYPFSSEPSSLYKIILYQSDEEIDPEVLGKTLQKMRESSFRGRVCKKLSDVWTSITKPPCVNFPN